jgi:hypothetical protein
MNSSVSPLALMNFNTLAGGLGIDTVGGGAPAAAAAGMPTGSLSMFGDGTLAGGGIYGDVDPMFLGGIGGTGGGQQGGGFAPSLGGPLGVAGLGLSALSSLGSLWMGMKSMKLAKKQFKFQKDFANTNLANSIQSYNTALADRARSRGVMEGQTQGQVDGYIAANALSRDSGKNGPTPTSSITGAALSNYSQYASPGYTSSQTTKSAPATSTPRDDDETNG